MFLEGQNSNLSRKPSFLKAGKPLFPEWASIAEWCPVLGTSLGKVQGPSSGTKVASTQQTPSPLASMGLQPSRG